MTEEKKQNKKEKKQEVEDKSGEEEDDELSKAGILLVTDGSSLTVNALVPHLVLA